MKKMTYKSAGVDIDAGNEAVNKIKNKVSSTFSENVLTGIGSFGSLYNLKNLISEYKEPIMVQSIDGVGTKTIIARKMKKYDTIGIDTANIITRCTNLGKIVVHGYPRRTMGFEFPGQRSKSP